jgi:hypothetical protein
MSKAQTIARIRAGWRDITPGQDIEIASYRPVDGEGVVRSILELYGDKYPVEDFYIPRRISQLNESGDMITLVARTGGGDVVGHASLWRTSSLNPHLYEYGQVVVVPAYRQRGLAQRLTEPLARILDANEDAHGVFVEAVTNHVASQRLAAFLGARPCALELALMPDGQFAGEGAGLSRVSCLMLARVIRDRRRSLCLPADSRAMLEPVVRDLGLERELSFSRGTEPTVPLTEMKVQGFGSAGVVRCHITVPGRDLVQCIAEIVERRFIVVELFIRADSMAAPWAVDVLQPLGFFLSGLVPLWFGADAIILQRLVGEIDTGALQLQSENANLLAAEVIAGYNRTR